MKKHLLLAAVLTIGGACSSSSSERPSTEDERQANIRREHGDDYRRERAEPDVDARDRHERAESDVDGRVHREHTREHEDVRANHVAADDDVATDDDATHEANEHEADNTGRNARDDDADKLTALDQSNSASDVDITQAIRKSVIANDDLSFNAKNVKIITVSGKVTLRGPVESAAERAAIEKSAREVPGVARVDNQIEVKH